MKILDYSEVKRFYADKLAQDLDGTGRIESAFFHAMRFTYLQGVEDGRHVLLHGDTVRAVEQIVGIDGGDNKCRMQSGS